MVLFVFLFKQKTAYEMRISDWSSDVCSSDLFGGKKITLKKSQSAEPFETILNCSASGYAMFNAISGESYDTQIDGVTIKSCSPIGGIFEKYKIGRASCRERVCQYV